MIVEDLNSAISVGLRGRCPNCAEGSVFDGFSKFASHCPACGFDFSGEDVADGPAVFIIFIASILIVPMALAFQLLLNASTALVLAIWVPILIAFCIVCIRPFRGLMFALQVRHKAVEVRFQEDGTQTEYGTQTKSDTQAQGED